MQYKITKSYRLLRYINADHTWVSRLFWGCLGFVGCLGVTGRLTLAREEFNLFFTDSFKTGFRRMAWYFRRGWPRLDVSHDHMYDFTEGLNGPQLDALERFIQSRKSHTDPDIHRCDLLYVSARRAIITLGSPDWQSQLTAFANRADDALGDIPHDVTPDKPRDGPRTGARKGDFSVENAAQTLADFGALFPIEHFKWYAISGTLLGLVREGNFLEHDYDIDLGIHAEDADLETMAEMVNQSDQFTLRKYDVQTEFYRDKNGQPAQISRPVLLKVVHVSGISLDLFVHYKQDNNRWHGSSIHRWNNSDFSLSEYELTGQTILGPQDAHLYLRENYGDWRTPVIDFNCTTDTKNQGVVCSPPSVALFVRRMVFAWQRRDPDAGLVRALLLQDGFIRETPAGHQINPDRLLPTRP